jgi:protein tyrosine/serine phosphatase
MQRVVRFVFGFSIAALIVGGPLGYSRYWDKRMRNFRVVRAGVLYRSGQMSLTGLKQVIREYGIRTVVTLRDAADPRDPPPDWAEEEYCKADDINYCRISPRSWWSPDGSIPAERGVSKFRAVMDDPTNYPVLVHCFAGVHRSGAFCAVYRMEYERWSNADAIAELRAHGYRNLDDEWDLLEYLEKYEPRWQRGEAAAHVDLRSTQDQPR